MAFEVEKKQLIDQYFGASTLKSDAELKAIHQALFWKDSNGGKLYKYRKINNNTIAAIKSNELYCSNPKFFNDPFDCNFGLQPHSLMSTMYSIKKERYLELLNNLFCVIKGISKPSDYSNEYCEIINKIINNEAFSKTISKSVDAIETPEGMMNFISSNGKCIIEILNIIFSSEFFCIPGVHFSDDLIEIFNNSSLEGKRELLSGEPDIYKFAIANGITADVDDIDRIELLYKKLLPVKGDLYSFSPAPKTTIETFNICCLTTKYTDRLMWAHYANNHSGICIEYDFNDIKSMKGHYSPYPVVYSKNRPPIPYIDMFPVTSEKQEAMINAIARGLLIKDNVWNYENEWRFLISKEERFLKMPKISTIYLGANIKEHNKRVIINLGKSLDISVKQMVTDRGIYALHAKDI